VVVFVVILVVVFGLLVPNVAKVRRAAARSQCENKLKQIALALHTYAATHSKFPAATISQPGLAPEDRLSWIVAILPQLERETLYRQIDTKDSWRVASATPSLQTALKELHCPGWVMEFVPEPGILTSYVGVTGVGEDAAILPTTNSQAGVFGYDRETALDSIKDGDATTLLLLETMQHNGPWSQGGPATARGLDPARQPYLGEGRPFGGMNFSDGSYYHRIYKGCAAAFVDGSVRSLGDSVSSKVLEALATKAGGESLPAEWW
jgi:hypothetical protein